MDRETLLRRRAERARARRRRRQRRLVAATAVAVVIAAIVVALAFRGSPAPSPHRGASATRHRDRGTRKVVANGRGRRVPHAVATGYPGHATAPILMYHVINPPPPGAPYPGLYVPSSEFAAQMRALKRAGYVAVTLNELHANWTHGAKLPSGHPVVITFDNGYRSQYTEALPVLRRLGWIADENLQLTGLPPDQGGLTEQQVRGLIAAGWELDTQGISHADLPDLNATELHNQVAGARRTLRRRYHVPVDWFCYPSGQYDPTVVAAVRAAGFLGATTVVPGWSSRASDPFELPRLRVLGGTSPQSLLAQIAAARTATAPPASYLTSS